MTPTTTIEIHHAEHLRDRFLAVRAFTERLAEPLSPEDCAIQSMPDVSPTKWHLAHTTWFFETFLLADVNDYTVFDSVFSYLFNSYYNSIGEQFPRHKRGLISRPNLDAVMAYRQHIDHQLLALLEHGLSPQQATVLELGVQHEQQHQELLLTDIKHVLAQNPLHPCYRDVAPAVGSRASEPRWQSFDGGVYWIGHEGDSFAFDNESPRHRVFLESFRISDRLVTCGEYLAFINDGGYQRPELWLSLGWAELRQQCWQAPLYWVRQDGGWQEFTLAGLQSLDEHAPVCHVSYFEADAFARWSGRRLPTEMEWEVAATWRSEMTTQPLGNYADTCLDDGFAIHPRGNACQNESPSTLLGDVWQWTASPYVAYPGYAPPAGALGEYNGKFMCNQFVMRGGSCATHSTHLRPTYRNFFPPSARWQFTGLRLCEDL